MKTNLLLMAILITLFQVAVFAQTAVQPTGSGTAEDPYKVETLNNLYWITQNSSSWNKYFIQTAHIDASSTAGWHSGAGFSPIGNSMVPFAGSYNGQGGTISGLTINRPNSIMVGLFGVINDGTVKNLGVVLANINSYYHAGGIAGYTLGVSEIEGCYSSGTVTASGYVGGITGTAEAGTTLTRCGTVASVNGSTFAGGFAGRNGATIHQCYAAGSVTGTEFTGGFTGQSFGTVTNSFWDTQASGQASSAGGTGKTTAEMKNLETYCSLATPGLDDAWDFIGTPYDDASTMDLWNMDKALGINNGYPLPSWWIIATQPIGTGTRPDPYQIASLNNLYWLMQTASVWVPDLFFAQTAEISAYSTRYIHFGKGFQPIGDSYAAFYGSFNGQDFLIRDLYINRNTYSEIDHDGDWMGLFGYKVFGVLKNIRLIDTYINATRFIGTLTGQAEDVDTIFNCSSENINLVYFSRNTGGLIGWLANSSHNCYLSGCYTTGSISQSTPHHTMNAGSIGGLIGVIYSLDNLTINNSFSECNITSLNNNQWHTGGFIGVMDSPIQPDISDCYATGTVNGNRETGGFIGTLLGYGQVFNIDHCYSTGPVSGTTDVGGLVGKIDAPGPAFNACFWDTENSGQINSAAGTGKTTAEMKTQTTFTGAGWDFEETWGMETSLNSGYPHLLWFYVPEVVTGDIANISLPSAECGGEVMAEGESTVTVRGIVWDTQPDPNLVNNLDFTENGSGVGTYTGTLTGLQEGYTYYVRAYATNSYGTGYGEVKSFFVEFTPPGNALYFNGVNQYVTLPDESAFDFVLAMTVECWIKVETFDKPWQAIITKGDNAWRIQRQNETDKITFATTHGGSPNSLISNTAITYGEWYHVAAIFDGTNKFLYINGQLDNSTGSAPIQTSNALVYLGENSESTGRYFSGAMDEVRIWNYARTAQQIADNYDTVVEANESGLVAYYRFDEVAGSLLPDLTTGSHNGTCANMNNSNWVPAGWPEIKLNIKVFLEGSFNGIGLNKAQDEMGDHFPGTVADKITVELAEASSPFGIVFSNNSVDLNTNGLASLSIPGVHGASYYIVIKHRNSVETWSASPVTFTGSVINYDFTTSASNAYGDNQQEVAQNVYGIFGGDVNQDYAIDTNDLGDIDNDASNFISGYVVNDANGDGIVDTNDMGLVDNNSSMFVVAVTP